MKYTKNHLWIKNKGSIAEIGITDFGQSLLGEVVFVNLPEEGDSFEVDETAFSIESSELEYEAALPFAGEVISVNYDLDDNPEILNESPAKTYIIRMKLSDPDILEDLLEKSDYKDFCDDY